MKLIRAETDRTLLAEIYEGEMSGMFSLHQQIASDLAARPDGPGPCPVRTPTINAKAYDAYVKGLNARGLQRVEGFRRAVAYLEEAVAIQPDFAEAHAELAIVQVQFLFGGPYSPIRLFPRLKRRRERHCGSMTTCRMHTGRWARFSTCTTGAGRKATRSWSEPRRLAAR